MKENHHVIHIRMLTFPNPSERIQFPFVYLNHTIPKHGTISVLTVCLECCQLKSWHQILPLASTTHIISLDITPYICFFASLFIIVCLLFHRFPGYPCDAVSGFWILGYVLGALCFQQLSVQPVGCCHGCAMGHHPKWLPAVSQFKMGDPHPVKKVIKWLHFVTELIVFP